MRSPLKWPGGKKRIVPDIQTLLPSAKRLIEPFVGSGAVFLNTDYDEYILADINPRLINFYRTVQEGGEEFIQDAKKLFVPENNNKEQYYRLRDEFNQTKDLWRQAQLILYVNRFCFNGLYRENSKGGFNVSFGRYENPYFPEAELRYLHEKSERATFLTADFREVMEGAESEDTVIYVDPPYLEISDTANFASYAKGGFSMSDHEDLAELCRRSAEKGIPVVASNHDVPLVHEVYHGAEMHRLQVSRSISVNTENRKKASEVLMWFAPVQELEKQDVSKRAVKESV